MTTLYENDVICLHESVSADVIGEKRLLIVPAGAIGAVVFVHGEPTHPLAYEIEFYIEDEDCYAIATIKSDKF